MIVKIQKSIGAMGDSHPQMIICNEDKSLFHQSEITEEVEGILGELNKAYFVVEIVDGIIEIGDFYSTELDW